MRDKLKNKTTIQAISGVLSRCLDAWIMMMALGGIASMQDIPRLAISYWTCLLIVIVSMTVFPQTRRLAAHLEVLVNRK